MLMKKKLTLEQNQRDRKNKKIAHAVKIKGKLRRLLTKKIYGVIILKHTIDGCIFITDVI